MYPQLQGVALRGCKSPVAFDGNLLVIVERPTRSSKVRVVLWDSDEVQERVSWIVDESSLGPCWGWRLLRDYMYTPCPPRCPSRNRSYTSRLCVCLLIAPDMLLLVPPC